MDIFIDKFHLTYMDRVSTAAQKFYNLIDVLASDDESTTNEPMMWNVIQQSSYVVSVSASMRAGILAI